MKPEPPSIKVATPLALARMQQKGGRDRAAAAVKQLVRDGLFLPNAVEEFKRMIVMNQDQLSARIDMLTRSLVRGAPGREIALNPDAPEFAEVGLDHFLDMMTNGPSIPRQQ